MTTTVAPVSRLSPERGIALSFLGGLLLSFDVPLLKLSGADTWTIIYVRGTMLFIALFLFWLFTNRLRENKTRFINGKTGYVIAVLAGVANIMFVASISLTSVANVVFILAFNPMFAGVLGWLFLKERLGPATWIAIACSLSGVMLIVAEGLQLGTWQGDLLALGVALIMAASLTIIRYSGTNQSLSAGAGHLMSAIFAAPFAVPGSLTAAGWGWLSINGLLVTPAATAFLMIGPRYVAAAIVAMFFLLETVLTPIWMWAIFSEMPSTLSLIGGAIVIASLAGHTLWRFKTKRDRASVPQ
ncbi:EamA family transporter [Anderseniella sp. Alg231-50]|uniref:EamA family transporter n=1 Tax=Anderseniella sp. Alg231-50 TaxID=1922226 RepID=UPI000D5616EC